MHAMYFGSWAVFPMLVFTTLLAISSAQEGRKSSAQIGFSSNLNDSEIAAFLTEYPVSPQAAFVWSYGLSGSHRTKGEMEPDAFLELVRSGVADRVKSSRKAVKQQLRLFADRHTQEELLAEYRLQSEARALLSYLKQTDGALATVLEGRALIFGLEVNGDRTTLDNVRSDPRVRIFFDIASGSVAVDQYGRMSLKPVAYSKVYEDPAVMALSAEDLLSAIENALTDAREEV